MEQFLALRDNGIFGKTSWKGAFQRLPVILDRFAEVAVYRECQKDRGATLPTVAPHPLEQIVTTFKGIHTACGLSNISFGLPARSQLNTAFLQMASFAGLDAAIADPLDEVLMAAIKTAQVLLGKDRHCRRYMRAFRS